MLGDPPLLYFLCVVYEGLQIMHWLQSSEVYRSEFAKCHLAETVLNKIVRNATGPCMGYLILSMINNING